MKGRVMYVALLVTALVTRRAATKLEMISHTELTEFTEKDRRLSHAQSLALLRGRRGRRGKIGLSHTEFTESTEKSKDVRREILESMHVHARNSRGEFFASHPYRMLRYR